MISNITNILLSFIVLFFASCSKNVTSSFLVSAGSPLFDECYGLSIDSENNIIISGVFSGDLKINETFIESVLSSKGQSDFFVAKYTPSGKLIWVKSFGDSSADEVANIAVDRFNNIYLTGYYNATPDFMPDDKSMMSTSFLLKLNKDGETIWTKKIEVSSASEGTSVCVKNNDVYWVSYSYSINSNESRDNPFNSMICTKLNLEGTIIAKASIGAFGNNQSKDVYVSENNHVFITGILNNTKTNSAAFVELDSNLNKLNQTYLFDTVPSEAISIIVDKKNNKYVAGSFLNRQNNQDAFICKLSFDNKLIWKNIYSSNGKEWAKSLIFDRDSNIIASLVLNSNAKLSNAKNIYIGKGSYDIVITAIDKNGNELNRASYGNEGEEGINKMILDDRNNLVFCGWYYKSLRIKSFEITSKGEGDAFLCKQNLNSILK